MRHTSSWNLVTVVTGLSLAFCTALSLGISEQEAAGQEACRQPLPCPTSADGVCRPNRPTWGWNQTRWRPWPGDDARLKPTPTEVGGEEGDEKDELKPFERPSAQDEDLRSLPKDEKEKKSADETEPSEEAMPGEEALEPLEPLEPLPLEGRVQPRLLPTVQPAVARSAASPGLPAANSQQEDAPPALPAHLQRLSVQLEGVQAAARPPATPRPTAPSAPAGHVIRTGWQQPVRMPLVNPAAATTVKPVDDQLRKAIYYEATDQPKGSILR